MPSIVISEAIAAVASACMPGITWAYCIRVNARGFMAEAFADHLHRDIRLEGDGGVGVVEVVQSDSR